nr:unnamed protein product [Callosobruchus chinensis]
MYQASFSEQRSVASYTSVTNRVSRIASPISPTTLSPATACVVEYFQLLHCHYTVCQTSELSSVVAGDTLQISQHKEWGSVAATVRSSENEALGNPNHVTFHHGGVGQPVCLRLCMSLMTSGP